MPNACSILEVRGRPACIVDRDPDALRGLVGGGAEFTVPTLDQNRRQWIATTYRSGDVLAIRRTSPREDWPTVRVA